MYLKKQKTKCEQKVPQCFWVKRGSGLTSAGRGIGVICTEPFAWPKCTSVTRLPSDSPTLSEVIVRLKQRTSFHELTHTSEATETGRGVPALW